MRTCHVVSIGLVALLAGCGANTHATTAASDGGGAARTSTDGSVAYDTPQDSGDAGPRDAGSSSSIADGNAPVACAAAACDPGETRATTGGACECTATSCPTHLTCDTNKKCVPPVPTTYPMNTVSVVSPAYTSSICGDTTVSIVAPGLTTATVQAWKGGGTFGEDSTVATVALDSSGKGSFVFHADEYPHGPTTVRIEGVGGVDGGTKDNAYLQLYNQGGILWNQGLPADPPQAAGMTVVYQDDFDVLPAISSTGLDASYCAHKPDYEDFSTIPFTDPTGAKNPFSQVDSYLRIRGDDNADVKSTGIISSVSTSNTGFKVLPPFYMECRFIAQSAIGTWPAFWTLTTPAEGGITTTGKIDELDIVEAYGGEGPGTPSDPLGYRTTSHTWNYTGDSGVSARIPMSATGDKTGWAYTFHTYGLLVTPTKATFYLDNVAVSSFTPQEETLVNPAFFMINFAIGGGGWKEDLSRYNGVADMYVDWVRVYH